MGKCISLFGIIVFFLAYLQIVGVASLPHPSQEVSAVSIRNASAFGLVPELQKRDEYDDCYNKGWALQCRLTRWSTASASNTWNDYAALQQNGWAAGDRTDEANFPHDYDPMFHGLGLDTEEEKWAYIEIDQIFDFPTPSGDEGVGSPLFFSSCRCVLL